MIYGCYGYTGEIAAREAVRRGMKPLLCGRDAARVSQLAEALDLESRSAALDDPGV